MKRKGVFFTGFILTFLIQGLFADIKVISPVEGKWANRQTLLIDTAGDEKADFYYSVDGSSPKDFGLAYDGAVFLDTTGDIVLKIARISGNDIEETEIKYTVDPYDAYEKGYADFIGSFYDSCILSSVAGSVLAIPEELYFNFDNKDTFFEGQDLIISQNCVIERYIPCTLWNKKDDVKWHFLVQTVPQAIGVYSKRNVPFYITDWDTVTFTDQDFIYKIDSEYWSLPKEPVHLDRSVSHMISWQSIAFEEGNPVEFFVLPPMPSITRHQDDDGSISFSLDGDDSYKIGILQSENKEITQLYDLICLDTFFGDKYEGELQVAVYSNSIYQGTFTENYSIDKCPPEAPVITASIDQFYSRNVVKVQVACDKNCDLYVSLSDDFKIEEVDTVYTPEDALFKNVRMKDFVKEKNIYEITFNPQGESAQYYKLSAYCKNEKNKSRISDFSVIIDLYNYYFDSNAEIEKPDGTAQNPYKSLSDCISSVNKTRSVCFRVKGDFVLPENKTILQANCIIKNSGNATLIFPADSTLIVKNSSLEIQGCRIVNKGDTSLKDLNPIIKMENGVLTLNDCTISTKFRKNGTVIDAYSSVINLSNILASTNSEGYSSFISGIKSRVSVTDSIIASNGSTSVIFSMNEGILSVTANNLSVTGQRGRIAELFANESYFMNNSFRAELIIKSDNLSPIYHDKKSKLVQSNNDSAGF